MSLPGNEVIIWQTSGVFTFDSNGIPTTRLLGFFFILTLNTCWCIRPLWLMTWTLVVFHSLACWFTLSCLWLFFFLFSQDKKKSSFHQSHFDIKATAKGSKHLVNALHAQKVPLCLKVLRTSSRLYMTHLSNSLKQLWLSALGQSKTQHNKLFPYKDVTFKKSACP